MQKIMEMMIIKKKLNAKCKKYKKNFLYIIKNPVIVKVILTGIIAFVIHNTAIKSAEKIAQSDQEIKLYELFNSSFQISPDTTYSESFLRLIGTILNTHDPKDHIYVVADEMFKQYIKFSIKGVHRKPKLRDQTSRTLAYAYDINKQYTINILINEIQPEGDAEEIKKYNANVNFSIVRALVWIKPNWEGTTEQFAKLQNLKNDNYFMKDMEKQKWLNWAILNFKERKLRTDEK
jgi:hypothetical protein